MLMGPRDVPLTRLSTWRVDVFAFPGNKQHDIYLTDLSRSKP